MRKRAAAQRREERLVEEMEKDISQGKVKQFF
jgi:hypothetical protein